MSDTPEIKRRKVLKGSLTGAAAFLAGCNSPSDPNPDGNQTESTPSPTDASSPRESGRSLLQVTNAGESVYRTGDQEPEKQIKLNGQFENRHQKEIQRVLSQFQSYSDWLDSLNKDNQLVEQKKGPVGAAYPFQITENGNGPNTYDRFWYNKPELEEVAKEESFKSSDTVQEALNWLHPYMNRWQFDRFSEIPLPKHNERFAPLLEEGIQQHHDFDLDVFPIQMYETKEGGTYGVEIANRDDDNRYGAMIGIDRSNGETLLMESNAWPEYDKEQGLFLSYKFVQPRAEPGAFDATQTPYESGDKNHIRAENSIHLPEHAEIDKILDPEDGATNENGEELYTEGIVDYEGNPLKPQVEEVNNQYWHPLRFNQQEPDVEGLDYETASQLVGEMFLNNTRPQNMEEPGFDNLAFTPEYLDSVTDNILHHEAFDYNQLKLESRAANTLEQKTDSNTVISGRIGESYAAEADQETVEEVWQDVQGEYNNIHEEAM